MSSFEEDETMLEGKQHLKTIDDNQYNSGLIRPTGMSGPDNDIIIQNNMCPS